MGKVIAFWIIWFIVSILIGKLWPKTLDSSSKKIPLSMGNSIIGFIVSAVLILAFRALIR